MRSDRWLKAKGKSESERVVEEVRRVIGRSTRDERELYEALVCEAEGWKMRLEELESEDEE